MQLPAATNTTASEQLRSQQAELSLCNLNCGTACSSRIRELVSRFLLQGPPLNPYAQLQQQAPHHNGPMYGPSRPPPQMVPQQPQRGPMGPPPSRGPQRQGMMGPPPPRQMGEFLKAPLAALHPQWTVADHGGSRRVPAIQNQPCSIGVIKSFICIVLQVQGLVQL